MSYSKRKTPVAVNRGEKIIIVVSFGYGQTQGHAHKSKKPEDVTEVIGEKPSWFDIGVEAALLAPTAVNQQKFKIVCDNGVATIRKNGIGVYMNVDFGILKYHFEAVTGQVVEIIK